MEKQFIDEKQNLQAEWYARAATIATPEQLEKFVHDLIDPYSHSMTTICHAAVALALGAIQCVNQSSEGGLSKPQQHQVLGMFVKRYLQIDGPMKLTQWAGILRPENKAQFIGIPAEVFETMRLAAEEILQDGKDLTPELIDHLYCIKNGKAPWGIEIMGEVKREGQ